MRHPEPATAAATGRHRVVTLSVFLGGMLSNRNSLCDTFKLVCRMNKVTCWCSSAYNAQWRTRNGVWLGTKQVS